MVRAFIPQAFRGDIPSNTNFPPQAGNESGVAPPQVNMLFNNTGEIMEFNNTSEIMVYN